MSFATHPLQLALGLTLWALWFVSVYGGTSLGCALSPPPAEAGAATWINLSLGLLTLATVSLMLWWARRCWRARERIEAEGEGRTRLGFIAGVAAALHAVAAVATAFVGLPLVALPPCV